MRAPGCVPGSDIQFGVGFFKMFALSSVELTRLFHGSFEALTLEVKHCFGRASVAATHSCLLTPALEHLLCNTGSSAACEAAAEPAQLPGSYIIQLPMRSSRF